MIFISINYYNCEENVNFKLEINYSPIYLKLYQSFFVDTSAE